jgi:surface carbohydrate biosynthesis protein
VTGSAVPLIVPVENQVRELDGKLLLACAAAERGHPVLLGSRAFVHYQVDAVPRGVYFAKSMRELSTRMFRILRGLGHSIVGFEEEALVRLADDRYYSDRLSPRTLEHVSLLLAWGEDDARLLRRYPGNPGVPVVVTGNPRVDLMRPELRSYYAEETREIAAAYGDFILVNTNFGQINHYFQPLGELKRALEPGASVDDFTRARAAHKRALFDAFVEMLPRLAGQFPDTAIVLRPHPSESHDIWRDVTSGFPNVKVINKWSVVPWLLAARVLVHNGCTTAVEAAVLGTPAVAFLPRIDARFDGALPNSLSHPASNISALGALVKDVLAGSLGQSANAGRDGLIREHIAALDGRLAADRMIDALEQAGLLSETPPPPALRLAWHRLATRARTALKQRNMRRSAHRNSAAYHDHRFPRLAAADLEQRIERFSDALGRFASTRVLPCGENVFWIRSGKGRDEARDESRQALAR